LNKADEQIIKYVIRDHGFTFTLDNFESASPAFADESGVFDTHAIPECVHKQRENIN
jgi:hypothetical protein